MRPASKLFCSAILLAGSVVCFAGEPDVKLDIRMPNSTYQLGKPIRLDIILKNLSSERLHIDKASERNGRAEAYISAEVRDSSGRPLPRTDGLTFVKNGKKYTIGKPWLSRWGIDLEPNQESQDFLVLSNLFDLGRPGNYIVSAKAEIRAPDSGPEIKWIEAASNTIEFTVKR
ncbi:MAG TPA: hypothetical protein VFW25_08165 [Silvibacterium sp.]|nr:hypothetical protein [Silvibacterium sp.]